MIKVNGKIENNITFPDADKKKINEVQAISAVLENPAQNPRSANQN